ncbi:hypothetical protein Bca4012_058521 [Brassica carinata]
MEANNEFAATLEKRLKDMPRSDELYEIKKVVRELKISLKMAQDRERANAAQLAAAEELRNQAASHSYLDVLVSLKDKWERKKVAANCETRLREVMAHIDLLNEIMNNNLLAADELSRLREKEIELGAELDVTAVSDFSVGKLDLPQASEDIPEELFGKVPAEGDGLDREDDRAEDGEFDADG